MGMDKKKRRHIIRALGLYMYVLFAHRAQRVFEGKRTNLPLEFKILRARNMSRKNNMIFVYIKTNIYQT